MPQAYSGLAFTHINLGYWFAAPKEAAPKAKYAVKKALAMIAHWCEWDWATAEREFIRAIDSIPTIREHTNSTYGICPSLVGWIRRSQRQTELSSLLSCRRKQISLLALS